MQPNYYEILYQYHYHKNSYTKAALAMYEYSRRLEEQASKVLQDQKQSKEGELCLEQQVAALTTAKNTITLVTKAEDQFFVYDKSCLTVQDLSTEFLVASARLQLLKRSVRINEKKEVNVTSFKPQDLVTKLSVEGLFETADRLATALKLDKTPIYEFVTEKYLDSPKDSLSEFLQTMLKDEKYWKVILDTRLKRKKERSWFEQMLEQESPTLLVQSYIRFGEYKKASMVAQEFILKVTEPSKTSHPVSVLLLENLILMLQQNGLLGDAKVIRQKLTALGSVCNTSQ